MNEDMHGAIRGLYEGILDAQAWQQSLSTLSNIVGSAHASMIVRDTDRDLMTVNEMVRPVQELFSAYEKEFHELDPGKLFAHNLSPGEWYIDARDFGEGSMQRSPFYRDFFHRFDLCSYAACLVERKPHYEVYFALQRSFSQGNFTPADVSALDWALPHMRSAMAMRDRTLGLSRLAQLSAQILERLSFGVIAFSPERRVLLSNGIGERWVRRLDPAGKAGEWQLSRSLADLVTAACAPHSTVPAHAAIARHASGACAQLIVLPLPPSHVFALPWQQPAALVVIHEDAQTPAQLPQLLREVYGLTPAEIRLASLLATGMGLPEASERLSVRHETARSQLKAVFLKTGASTQARLTRLLTQLGTALGPGPKGQDGPGDTA
ncbi:helix-turn-helix transcriptional regulator [Cupriavidus sp. CV2]|uniref:helix-turn-helix transcriptional regulator n=1 Tax=Cupriavidus ulmosensis TaxID=3065913 RepID=UPI00296ACC3C|nr:helix-turn-helix transcriptional regulator [Cupriavidus sp. CV2]MDW3688840.1 helix-turn-helix transcriptional regulator [Cupriavidus sp. CV2]